MSTIGEDFDLEFDDILEPEAINPKSEQKTEGDDKSTEEKDEKKSDPKLVDDDVDGIDLEYATSEPSEEKEDDDKDTKSKDGDRDDKDEDEDKDTKERTDDHEDSSSSNISAFASALYEQGAFPDIDEEELKKVKNAEDLVALNRKQIEANEFRDLTPLQKEALEAFRSGVDPEKFSQAKSRELRYESIDPEKLDGDEDLAKQIIKDYLSLNNTPEDVADDLIKSYEIDEKIVEKAKSSLPKITQKIKEQNKQEEARIKNERDSFMKNMKDNITNTEEILKGVKISESEKRELFEQMTKPAKVLEDGTPLDYVMLKRQEDPMGFMTKLHYYAKLGLFDKKVNSELLTRKVKTNALKEFEEKLNDGNSTSKLRGGDPTPSDYDMYEFDDIPDVKLNK